MYSILTLKISRFRDHTAAYEKYTIEDIHLVAQMSASESFSVSPNSVQADFLPLRATEFEFEKHIVEKYIFEYFGV